MSLLRYAALLVVFLTGFAAAQAPAESDNAARRLIEQKIRLVEMLINSPAARNAPYGREAESAAMVEQGRQAIDAAKQALAEDRFDNAMALADEALKSVSAASRKLSAGGSALSDSAQRKTMEDLTVQIDMYRTSLVGLTKEGANREAAQALLSRIDSSGAQAAQLAKDGRVGEANKMLAETYKLAVEEISRLRAGQEVIMSLKFDTPAEEYAYEQRRFSSNEMMVEMMISEGRADGDRRKLVDGFAGEGRRLKGEADARASAGHYDDAIGLMEKATGQLNRALQSMGVPVF